MKTCTKCGESKPLEDFCRDRHAASGLTTRCKECVKAYTAARRAQRGEADRVHINEVQRAWRAKNKDRVQAYNERWRSTPRRYEYERENAEGIATLTLGRNAKRRGASHVETISPLIVLELHDGVCGICGEDVDPLAYDIDHIVPIALGGLHTYENVQPAHPLCNQAVKRNADVAA